MKKDFRSALLNDVQHRFPSIVNNQTEMPLELLAGVAMFVGFLYCQLLLSQKPLRWCIYELSKHSFIINGVVPSIPYNEKWLQYEATLLEIVGETLEADPSIHGKLYLDQTIEHLQSISSECSVQTRCMFASLTVLRDRKWVKKTEYQLPRTMTSVREEVEEAKNKLLVNGDWDFWNQALAGCNDDWDHWSQARNGCIIEKRNDWDRWSDALNDYSVSLDDIRNYTDDVLGHQNTDEKENTRMSLERVRGDIDQTETKTKEQQAIETETSGKMSDYSSSTAANSEWDKMSQCLSEMSSVCTTTGEIRSIKMSDPIPYSNSEWENKSQCLSEMDSDIDSDDTTADEIANKQKHFKLMPWMKEEIEEVTKSIVNMKTKTEQLYKIILVFEKMRQEKTSRMERRNGVEIIHQLEDICERFSASIININAANVQAIEERVHPTCVDVVSKIPNGSSEDPEEVPSTFEPNPWMKLEIEQVAASVKWMEDKTKLLYKKIIAEERSRAASKSRTERAKLSAEILEMEALCEENSSAIKRINDENINCSEDILRLFQHKCSGSLKSLYE